MKKIRKTEPQDFYERLRLLELIVTVPESRMPLIYDLYPEYFAANPRAGSLEYTSAVNSSYLKWIQDYDITRDWIREIPTIYITTIRSIASRIGYTVWIERCSLPFWKMILV